VTDRPDDPAVTPPEVVEPSAEAAATPQPDPVVLRPRRVGLLAAIAGTVVILDLLTKIIVVATIDPNQPVKVLGGLVYLSLIRNPGAAFSMATGMTWLLALVAIVVVIVIIRMAPRLRSTPWAISLGLVLGGAIGNLIDRIFRAPGILQGHVVDFVSVFGPNAEYFPVFNVADSAITIGGISLVITALLGIDFDGTSTRKPREIKGESA
jgi:signal peptidase II